MLLIADSGSTKCDWVLFENKDAAPIKIRTEGLNPSILKKEAIEKIILENSELLKYRESINFIYFYGAGCNSVDTIQVMESIFHSYFKNAKVVLKEDTMAAVKASTNTAAVVCILGTGSNCCFFDGNQIYQKVPAMGYMLMDEASGNYFGKELLKCYYYNEMPQELKVSFENRYDLNENTVIKQLYQSETPNKYLAEFAIFLFKNKENEVMQKIIKDGISKFIDHQILQYKAELKSVPLYFVGSIAFYAQDFMNEALKKRGLRASRYIKRPIENLISKIKEETF
ncbi:N-acetylglucosamine kinase [Lutibacter sp.]|uniref:N-acetylglucosamine kinase n=1 Tax=Lutibacter sp. TaxID=1925666 RepID=UPI001A20B351|nr:N-acetylglucosamine kinase [Lutibacter sp.]MBI9040766.1 N-acetylglucosamine kinase [Lutibacter sp.]